MTDPEPLLPEHFVTVVGPAGWHGRADQLAQLIRNVGHQPGPKVIPSPDSPPTSPARLAEFSDPDYWATDIAALADAIAAENQESSSPDSRLSSGAVTSGTERLTLTVEEAATLLGISRASAYEAVRQGEIPAIRIGRRILVPKAALERLLSPPSESKEGNSES